MTVPGVLIVEDNATAREDLAVFLRRQGFEVATAPNGLKAFEYLNHKPTPRVILLDMLLPVLDGWRFLDVVLKMDLDPKPCIIVTTGSPVIGWEWALAHGCKGLLHKPIDPEALLEGIRAASAN